MEEGSAKESFGRADGGLTGGGCETGAIGDVGADNEPCVGGDGGPTGGGEGGRAGSVEFVEAIFDGDSALDGAISVSSVPLAVRGRLGTVFAFATTGGRSGVSSAAFI